MLKNEKKQEALVEMKQEDLVSLQKFMVRVESLGNFIWKASQRELNKLKSYLYEQTETAENITQMGWNRNGFYAFGNGVYYEGEFIKADDNGIVAGDVKATVTGEIVKQGKNKKVIVSKYKAKKGYRRKNGHRQPYTRVLIKAINA